MQRFLWMIGGPFAGLGLLLVLIAMLIFSHDSGMKGWPRADGVITSSKIDATMTQVKDKQGYYRSWESCVPKVRYTYTADANTSASKELEGSRLTREPFAASRGEAQQWIDRYPVGKAVKVYYDPKDPASSVLELKTSVAVWILGPLGALFLLVGLGIGLAPKFVKGLR